MLCVFSRARVLRRICLANPYSMPRVPSDSLKLSTPFDDDVVEDSEPEREAQKSILRGKLFAKVDQVSMRKKVAGPEGVIDLTDSDSDSSVPRVKVNCTASAIESGPGTLVSALSSVCN